MLTLTPSVTTVATTEKEITPIISPEDTSLIKLSNSHSDASLTEPAAQELSTPDFAHELRNPLSAMVGNLEAIQHIIMKRCSLNLPKSKKGAANLPELNTELAAIIAGISDFINKMSTILAKAKAVNESEVKNAKNDHPHQVSTSKPVSSPSMSVPRQKLTGIAEISVLLSLFKDGAMGTGVDNDGCFFDALAQALNEHENNNRHSEKSLRMACLEFYNQNKKMVDTWNTKEFGGIDQGDSYYDVQYTADELAEIHKQGGNIFAKRLLVLGRSIIEGCILCHALNLPGIHLVEMITNPEDGKRIATHSIITSEKVTAIEAPETTQYLAEMPVLAVNGKYFVPILQKKSLSSHSVPDKVSVPRDGVVGVNSYISLTNEEDTALEYKRKNIALLCKQLCDRAALLLEYLSTSDAINEAEINSFIKGTRNSINHLVALTYPFLDKDGLSQELTPEPVMAIVQGVRFMSSSQAAKKGLEIKLNFGKGVSEVLVIETLAFRQVLINVITNAIQATLEGSITINLSRISNTSPLHVSITDTGPGIPLLTINKIMTGERFYRGNKPTYTGTGLGLPLSKELIENVLQGSFNISSISDGSQTGSTITFTVAAEKLLMEEKIPLIASPQEKTTSTNDEYAELQGKKILVVDDSIMIQNIFGKILHKEGVIVEFADHGEEAVEKAERTAYDLILMDLVIPVLDGFMASSEIRARKITTPIIGLSGNESSPLLLKKVEAAGMNSYLTKPVFKKNLCDTILKVLLSARSIPTESISERTTESKNVRELTPTTLSSPSIPPSVLTSRFGYLSSPHSQPEAKPLANKVDEKFENFLLSNKNV